MMRRLRALVALLSLLAAEPALAQSGRAPFNGASTLELGLQPPLSDGSTTLWMWLKADVLVGLSNGAAVELWPDLSGNSNDASQSTAGSRPTFRTSDGPNGRPSIRFDGTNDFLSIANSFASLNGSGGEIFIVVKIANDYPSITESKTGLWVMTGSTQTDRSTHYPWYTDGVIYEGFGTNARKTAGNPTPSLAAWRVYSVLGISGTWSARLDGASSECTAPGTPYACCTGSSAGCTLTTVANTVAFATAPEIGHSFATFGLGNYYLDGDVSEIVMYSGSLSNTSRRLVFQYLSDKYALGITTLPILGSCELTVNNLPAGQGKQVTRNCDPSVQEGFVWPFMWLPNMPTSGTVQVSIEAQPVYDNEICTGFGTPVSCCTGLGGGSCGSVCVEASIGCASGGTTPSGGYLYAAATVTCSSLNTSDLQNYGTMTFSSLALPGTVAADRQCAIMLRRVPANASDTSSADLKIRAGRLIF